MKSTFTKVLVCFVITFAFLSINIFVQQTDIIGPAESGQFGKQIVALPNGNIIFTDPT